MPARPSWIYLAIGYATGAPARLLLRMRASGLENVPSGGCVLAPSHVSNFDVWAVGLPLFPRRFLRFMAKAELYKPALGWILEQGGAFPVRRGAGDAEAIETAVELCRAGQAIVVFPEGTRRKKGLVKRRQPRPHTGAARIALAAGVPLIPVAVAGTDRLSRLGPVRVRFGEPLPLDDLDPADSRSAAEEATSRLMAELRRLEASL
ncbi:MAG: 1-acyl-sn-glycerol-3-phosphate acyltransferase [Thermoleophilia bacterium]|nr:1-acyl-sn-glycerol-3-phosphate acyltransferase [Thermoleophilia bacterium]